MAVPANITALNLNGKFQMVCRNYHLLYLVANFRFLQNKSLSDSPDDMLSAQGVGWIKRKAMGAATITVTLTHSKDASGMENLSLVQVVSGGDPAEPEEKVFDWVERKKEIKLFGPCVTKSKRVSLDEVQEPFLKEGWSADTLEHGCILVHLANEGKNGWKTEQVCDFRLHCFCCLANPECSS
ncbi:hypothetical protein F5890DRAFT_1510461 [Lentinula detonsa]|uniref:Uncharacterized protein n=1 Tax=Lentinula detonsa TaxID=2804962 RepID=A0AA38Q293_9AGAR|nr:hypothetical protein F5890DRAFT_1510461 [Lentinula detonsa]